jgi:putative ABC transport system permease protein
MVSAIDRKLLRDMRQLKGQVLTVALVVTCGIAGYVTFQSTWRSLESSKRSYYEQYRFADAFVRLKRAPEVVAQRLERIPGVARVYPRIVYAIRLPIPGPIQPPIGEIVSLPDGIGQPPLNRLVLEERRMPERSENSEAVLLTSFARRFDLGAGDSLPAVINGTVRTIHIVGLASSPEYVFPTPVGGGLQAEEERFAVLWMPRGAVAPDLQMEGAFNNAVFSLQPGAAQAAVLREIDRILEPYGGLLAVGQDRQESNYIVTEEMEQLRTWATVVPLIFLSVSAFLVNVVLSRLVSLQRPEIATLKAIGYSDRDIGLHFLKLVSVVVLLGALLGLGLGTVLGRGLTGLYTRIFHFPMFVFHVPAVLALVAAAVSLLAAGLGAASAVWQVMALTPAEAMRPPSPAVYRPLISERIGLGKFVSQAGRMILRELERQPLRTLFSALGIAAAIAVLVVGRIGQDAFEQVIDVQFQRAWREDLSVSFQDPVAERAVRELAHLPGVRRAEGARMVAARAEAGSLSRDVAIMGYARDAELRRAVDREGKVLALPAEGCLISAQLGRSLGVQVGDTIRLAVLQGERKTYPLRVAGWVEDLAGLQIYMELGALERMLGEGPSVNTVLLTIDPSFRATLEHRLNDMPKVAVISSRPSVIQHFREQSGTSMFVISAVLTAFAATIAIGVVYNNARVALSMRSRDLASLRVLGFTRREISGILLSELAFQVLLALPFGVVLSRWLTSWIVSISHPERFRLPGNISSQRLGFAVLVAILAAIVSGLMVRRQLDHLDLVAVLKTRE